MFKYILSLFYTLQALPYYIFFFQIRAAQQEITVTFRATWPL